PNVLAVCEALAYAHSEGVIHRDLKPSNVIVGAFGETIVIDWGLAKDTRAGEEAAGVGAAASSSHGDLTMAGALLGTPSYMAPEQAAGDPADARSDVYALGSILYRVLAGAPPYDGKSADQVLAQLITGPPPALAERAPDVPADQLAIVDKAMAREPGDRYPDARALADELRRFQTGQLVGAHHYTAGQLLRRWLRRHRGAVAVGAAALLVLAGVSTYAIRRVVRERNAAEAARADEAAQRKLALAKKDAAEGLMAFMLQDVGKQLKPLDLLDLLEGIAGKVREYDERFGKDDRDPANLARRWDQEILIGDVLVEKGDIKGAEEGYREALRIADLLDAREANADHGRMVAETRARVAHALRVRGRNREAAAQLEQSVARLQPLADAGNRGAIEALGDALDDLGGARFLLGELDAAQKAYERARDLAGARIKNDPAHQGVAMRQFGQAMARLGDLQRERGDIDGALASFGRMLEMAEEGLKYRPQDADILFGKGFILTKLGLTRARKHDTAGAMAEYRRAESTLAQLVAVMPSGRNRFYLAMAVGGAAAAQADAAQAQPAIDGYRRAIAMLEDLTATDPEYADWQIELAGDYLGLATQLLAQPTAVREVRGLADRADYILRRLEKEGRLDAFHADLRAREQALRAKLP
ncbi:MAG TPA: protein kinase, partial [Kofleriaceae bacterium]|nr:protein kinase [Kofleriaceae bacterium]